MSSVTPVYQRHIRKLPPGSKVSSKTWQSSCGYPMVNRRHGLKLPTGEKGVRKGVRMCVCVFVFVCRQQKKLCRDLILDFKSDYYQTWWIGIMGRYNVRQTNTVIDPELQVPILALSLCVSICYRYITTMHGMKTIQVFF